MDPSDLPHRLERLLAICEASPSAAGDTATDHLAWMCRTALAGVGSYPMDKIARWAGYVRGCLTFHGLTGEDERGGFGPPLASPEDLPLLHHAHRVLFARYLDICAANDDGDGPTSNGALAETCRESMQRLGSRCIAGISETLGFVQGCLTCKGLVTVGEERDLSRPLFHAAYAETGSIPPTLERPSAS